MIMPKKRSRPTMQPLSPHGRLNANQLAQQTIFTKNDGQFYDAANHKGKTLRIPDIQQVA